MHVVVTGASSGIGAAIAKEWSRAGAKVTLVARRAELLREVATACGPEARPIAADLSDPATACAWLPEAVAAQGPIDVLVLNAGVELTSRVVDTDPAEGERLLRVNLLVPIALTRSVLPDMLARGSGAIVHVCSVDGLVTLPGHAWYGASKAGLASFSEVLRPEVAARGVHVLTVYPGPVDTAMAERAYAAYGGRKGVAAWLPEGTPDELARRVRRAVERRSRRLVYPRFYRFVRYFPWAVRAVYERATEGLLPSR